MRKLTLPAIAAAGSALAAPDAEAMFLGPGVKGNPLRAPHKKMVKDAEELIIPGDMMYETGNAKDLFINNAADLGGEVARPIQLNPRKKEMALWQNDNSIQLNQSLLDNLLDYNWPQPGIKLSDIMTGPGVNPIFTRYPELKEFALEGIDDPDLVRLGEFDLEKGTIKVNNYDSPEGQRDSLFHEIQHYIQEFEGWPKGGNPEMFSNQEWERKEVEWYNLPENIEIRALENRRDVLRNRGLRMTDEEREEFNGLKDKITLAKTNLYRSDNSYAKLENEYEPQRLYKRLTGEQQASITGAMSRDRYDSDTYPYDINQSLENLPENWIDSPFDSENFDFDRFPTDYTKEDMLKPRTWASAAADAMNSLRAPNGPLMSVASSIDDLASQNHKTYINPIMAATLSNIAERGFEATSALRNFNQKTGIDQAILDNYRDEDYIRANPELDTQPVNIPDFLDMLAPVNTIDALNKTAATGELNTYDLAKVALDWIK